MTFVCPTLLVGKKTTKQVDDSLNFEEQILEAAKAIAAATSALVKVATATQRELAAQGRISATDNIDKDSVWSEGLVSAARMVAAATSTLCEAANAAVQVLYISVLIIVQHTIIPYMVFVNFLIVTWCSNIVSPIRVMQVRKNLLQAQKLSQTQQHSSF